jgi:hypothetical protein
VFCGGYKPLLLVRLSHRSTLLLLRDKGSLYALVPLFVFLCRNTGDINYEIVLAIWVSLRDDGMGQG